VSLTRRAALETAIVRLEAAGLGAEEAGRDARWLLAAALETSPGRLAAEPDAVLADAVQSAFSAFLDRRAAREPVSQILESQPFWTLDLKVTRDVLTPRPDTETLVQAALDHVAERRDAALRVLDLGTGSGAILLALLSELPEADGLGIDVSEAALAIARANAMTAGLADRAAFHAGDWATGVHGAFDLIVSNPPYIPSPVIETLAPEVRDHDPRVALDGGADGLDAYRRLLADIRTLLAPGGAALFEIGFDQAETVSSLARQAGWRRVGLRRDLGGHARVITLKSDDDPATT